MIEKLFENSNLQGTWESILLQLKTMLNPESFFFWDALKVFFDQISANPLASIITLAALVGLPYTLYKAKQSNTKANERLDQLMDEMQDFEFEKPLIDLQEKFKGGSFDNSPMMDYDQDVLELNFDKVGPPFGDEDVPILQDLESTSFVKQITLDQNVTDDFLASGSMNLTSNLNDESLDLSALSEDFFNKKEFNPLAEPDIDEKESADLFAEDLQIKNEDPVLSFIEEKDSNENQVDTSQPIDLIIEPEETVSHETASPEADDLQTRMEQAIQKLKSKYAPLEEKEDKEKNIVDEEPVPLDINKMKKASLSEEVHIAKPDDDASLPSEVSASSGSPKGRQSDSLKKSHVITHLNSFKKNFENQLDTNGDELKKNANDTPLEQSAFFKTIYKPKETTRPKKSTTTDEEYQQSLESFLFLKDQEKPE